MAKSYGFFPDNLKLIRESMNITQTEFGKLVGATKTMIQTYETGKAYPKSLMLKKIAAISSIQESALKNKQLQPKELPNYSDFTPAMLAYIDMIEDNKQSLTYAAQSSSLPQDAYLDTVVAIADNRNKIIENLRKYFTENEIEDIEGISGKDFFEIVDLIKSKQRQPLSKSNELETQKKLYLRKQELEEEYKNEDFEIIPCYQLDAKLIDDMENGIIHPDLYKKRYPHKPLVIPNLTEKDFDFALEYDPEVKNTYGFNQIKGEIMVVKIVFKEANSEWNLDSRVYYIAISNNSAYFVIVQNNKPNSDFVSMDRKPAFRIAQKDVSHLLAVRYIITNVTWEDS